MCIVIVCFVEVNVDGCYNEIVVDVKVYVIGLQNGVGGDGDENDFEYGGVGYGGL